LIKRTFINKHIKPDNGGGIMKQPITFAILSLYLIIFTACASQRPVLYPNTMLQDVGSVAAETEIDECIQLAHKYGADSDKSGEIAKDAAENAAVAGVAGAAAGAIYDNVGKGAGAGAAAAGAATLTRGLFRSKEPDSLFRGFVERCLREKGYEPVGWK
jgi:hypothetical protein